MTLAPSRQATWFMLILVIVLVIAYGNTFTVPFIFDDSVNIIENPSIRQLWPPWYPLMIPLDTGLANRPVVNLSLAIWSDVIAKRPDNFRGYHGLGLALVGKGKYEEGLDQLRHALQLRPANAYANNDTGYVLFLLKRPGEALPFLREAVRIKPFNAKAQNNLGAALAQTGNLPEALVHFSEALKIRPDYLEARNNLNRARSEQARLYPGMNQRPVRELQPGRWQGGSQ